MSKQTLTILSIIAAIVVLAAIGYGIHHMMNPTMPMR